MCIKALKYLIANALHVKVKTFANAFGMNVQFESACL